MTFVDQAVYLIITRLMSYAVSSHVIGLIRYVVEPCLFVSTLVSTLASFARWRLWHLLSSVYGHGLNAWLVCPQQAYTYSLTIFVFVPTMVVSNCFMTYVNELLLFAKLYYF